MLNASKRLLKAIDFLSDVHRRLPRTGPEGLALRPRQLNNKGLVSLSRRHKKLAFQAAKAGFGCAPAPLGSWEGQKRLAVSGGGGIYTSRCRWVCSRSPSIFMFM